MSSFAKGIPSQAKSFKKPYHKRVIIMKTILKPFDCAGQICEAMKKGILLTTKAGDFVNTMTIGWGHMGIEWGRPIFVAYVRETRHTRQMLDDNGEFTVNVPVGSLDPKILGYCGSKSGRDVNKIADLDLTLEDPISISVPGIKELPLTLECKVIYKQDQDSAALHPDVMARYYKPGTRNEGDYHTMYFGEITAAYIIE
jgi:flavin reductase (DIM6/NTAB) family NADH-FMN oxidoreductase RutF